MSEFYKLSIFQVSTFQVSTWTNDGHLHCCLFLFELILINMKYTTYWILCNSQMLAPMQCNTYWLTACLVNGYSFSWWPIFYFRFLNELHLRVSAVHMTDMLGLDAVYAKWEKGPNTRSAKSLPAVRDVIERGKKAWSTKFQSVPPPPQRRTRQTRRKNQPFQIAVSSILYLYY